VVNNLEHLLEKFHQKFLFITASFTKLSNLFLITNFLEKLLKLKDKNIINDE
jgi:hypothetical protein